jgi:hypothetical protein
MDLGAEIVGFVNDKSKRGSFCGARLGATNHGTELGALIHGAEAFVSVRQAVHTACGQALRAYVRGVCTCMTCMCV